MTNLADNTAEHAEKAPETDESRDHVAWFEGRLDTLIALADDIEVLRGIVFEMTEPSTTLTEIVGRLAARRSAVREIAVRLKDVVRGIDDEDLREPTVQTDVAVGADELADLPDDPRMLKTLLREGTENMMRDAEALRQLTASLDQRRGVCHRLATKLRGRLGEECERCGH